MILDGKVIPATGAVRRLSASAGSSLTSGTSGKAHTHGGNIQAVIAQDGFPLWVPQAEPGSLHDITAARIHGPLALYYAAAYGLPTWLIPGTTARHRHLHSRQVACRWPRTRYRYRTRNALVRSLRCLGERGFALLTGRLRTLQHITASPGRIGDIARAALVLTHFEYSYIK
jgi:hypothetical protein